MKTDTNAERITARVPPSVKKRLEQAAELSGASSLNQFVVNAALHAAEQVFAREKTIRLSESASRLFFELLDNPPAPNERLRAAIEKYKTDLHANRASKQET